MDVCNLDLCYSLYVGISDLLPILKLTLYAIVVVYLSSQTITLLDS